ncbi:MAG: hypothetical protein ACMG55_17025, partial [Microcoleus sp.]
MTALRGDTPIYKDIVKKCVFNYKVSIKREGRSRGGREKKPIARRCIRARLPVNGCLAWVVQLCRQQLIGH